LAHEFDEPIGSRGLLRRGLARINTGSLTVPAERKRQLILSTSGRSFHGRGTTYTTQTSTNAAKGEKRAPSSGAAHYRYIENEEAAHDLAEASGHVGYIDGSRVEVSHDGDRLSRSNIQGTFEDRVRFFALAEMFERSSRGDKVSVDANRVNPALGATLNDPDCDPGFKAGVAAIPLPQPDRSVKIQLEGSNKDLRQLLEKHGPKLSNASKNEQRLVDDGLAFHSGRSGRTHFRWVFEVPEEFTAKQRRQVLDGLCSHMDGLKCMYAAVIHAPDPNNDERNHHIHLIFYDRPCRRLTCTDADLVNVGDAWKDDILDDIAEKRVPKGEWDFAVQRHYKSNRSWKIHYPFRADKSREVTKGKDFKKRFRGEYATIVNEVAAKAGLPMTYDPRSYADREVDILPSKHLGALHQSEIAGIPSMIGLSNEANQARNDRQRIMTRFEVEEQRLAALELKLAPFRQDRADGPVSAYARQPMEDISEARAANEKRLAVDLWALETARERSRAVLVRDRQRRAEAKGPAHEREARAELARAADAHLAELDREDTGIQRIINQMQRDVKRAPEITDKQVDGIVLVCQFLQAGRLAAAQRTAAETQMANAGEAPQAQAARLHASQARESNFVRSDEASAARHAAKSRDIHGLPAAQLASPIRSGSFSGAGGSPSLPVSTAKQVRTEPGTGRAGAQSRPAGRHQAPKPNTTLVVPPLTPLPNRLVVPPLPKAPIRLSVPPLPPLPAAIGEAATSDAQAKAQAWKAAVPAAAAQSALPRAAVPTNTPSASGPISNVKVSQVASPAVSTKAPTRPTALDGPQISPAVIAAMARRLAEGPDGAANRPLVPDRKDIVMFGTAGRRTAVPAPHQRREAGQPIADKGATAFDPTDKSHASDRLSVVKTWAEEKATDSLQVNASKVQNEKSTGRTAKSASAPAPVQSDGPVEAGAKPRPSLLAAQQAAIHAGLQGGRG